MAPAGFGSLTFFSLTNLTFSGSGYAAAVIAASSGVAKASRIGCSSAFSCFSIPLLRSPGCRTF